MFGPAGYKVKLSVEYTHIHSSPAQLCQVKHVLKENTKIKDGTPQREGAQLDDAMFHAVKEVYIVYVHRVENKSTLDLERE